MAIHFDLELAIKNLFVPPRAQQISMLVMEATKCSWKEPNQGYCMATLWTQNYGWGKSMKVWVDVTLAVSVWSIVENGAFWLNRGSPPSPLPQLYCTCTGWGSPCHSAHRRLFKQKTSLTALNSLHFFLLFKPTHTHKMSIASQWQPKKILKYFICS